MIMTSSNQQVSEYLEEYIGLSVAPGFAVMITGPWGCGKSWFVKKALTPYVTEGQEKDGKEKKVTYVSVSGMRDTAQIDEAIFAEMHPFLTSPKMRLLGRVAKGFLKGAVKINLDDDSFSATLGGGIPDIASSDLNIDYHSNIFIFDDFERCQVDKIELLGYINHFVETLGCKVILICNEERVDGKEPVSGESEYREVKEKVVGATLSVEPDFSSAFDSFVEAVPSLITQSLLRDKKDVIHGEFENAGNSNLRILRHAFFDFNRLVEAMDPRYQEKIELTTDVLREFLPLYCGFSTSALRPGDIGMAERPMFLYSRLRGDGELTDQENRVKRFLEKNPECRGYAAIIPFNFWTCFIESGVFDKEALNLHLSRSKYFPPESRPLWLKAFNLFDTDDDEADHIVNECLEFVDGNSVEDMGACLHVFGALLYASEAGIAPLSKEEIIEKVKLYIERVEKRGEIRETAPVDRVMTESQQYEHKGFLSSDTEAFKDLYEHYRKAVDNSHSDQFRVEAGFMPDRIRKDLQSVCADLAYFKEHEGRYANIPILLHVDVERFATELLRLPPEDRYYMIECLRVRYEGVSCQKNIASEWSWLEKLCECLREYSEERSGRLSAYRVSKQRKALLEIVERLKEGEVVE